MPAVSPLLVTSIPPLGGKQLATARYLSIERNIASFAENGFSVAALLRTGEDPDPALVDKVQYTLSENEGHFVGRYGPTFSDLLKGVSGQVGAVVNCDVYMPKSNIAELCNDSKGTVFVSRRIDVSALGGMFQGVYSEGIDGMFFTSDVNLERIRESALGMFQLGVPFWDLVIPLALSFHHDVKFTAPPVLFHPLHEVVWNEDDYRFMRANAVISLIDYAQQFAPDNRAARLFLNGIASYQASFSRRSEYRDQKRAAEYIAHRIRLMSQTKLADLTVDLNDPHVRDSIVSLLSFDGSALELARELLGRDPEAKHSYFSISTLRNILKIRSRINKNRRINASLRRIASDYR